MGPEPPRLRATLTMTNPFSSLPVLLLAAATATAQAGSPPALLPASLTPAGLRLQATFAAARPDQGMAVFGLDGQTHLRRAGNELGNGLQLLRILADRVVLGHGSREYYLPLRPAPAGDRRNAAVLSNRSATPSARTSNPASRVPAAAVGTKALQASDLDEVRQQCRSSAVTQLSAAQQQEIQALGLCP